MLRGAMWRGALERIGALEALRFQFPVRRSARETGGHGGEKITYCVSFLSENPLNKKY